MPAQKTSITAYGVACGLDKLARMPRWQGYFSNEMRTLNAAFMRHAQDTPFKRVMGWLPPRLYIGVMDALFIPGMVHHFLFRKRLIESELVKAVDSGVRQVVVLGAGLDTLALRMAPVYAAVRFFEIDLPHTQQAKCQALEQMHHAAPPNCSFVPADLSQTALESVLRAAPGFAADKPTLVIVEGVLMYLGESEVKALFITLHALFTGSLTVLFGAMAASDDEAAWRVRLFNQLLRNGQEATKWHCAGADMPAFMAELGYDINEWITFKALQRLYRGESEIRAVPEEDENYYRVRKKAG